MKRSRNLWLPVMLIILGIFVFGQLGTRSSSKEIEYSSFVDFIEQGRVDSVIIERSNGRISGELSSPTQILGNNGEQVAIQTFTTTAIVTDTLINQLTDSGSIDVSFRNPPQWQALAFSIVPLIILLGFLIAMLSLIWFIVRFFTRKDKGEQKS